MAQYNKVTFIGRLGQDPEMSYTPNGTAVTKFSIAVNQGKDQKPMWLNIVCWDKLAERANTFTRKGAEVLVDGKLKTRSYTDKQNIERMAFDIVAHDVQVFGSKPKEESTSGFAGSDDALGDLDEHPF